MSPSVSRMTPEPSDSPSSVSTVIVTTEGRHFSATASATVESSPDGVMVTFCVVPLLDAGADESSESEDPPPIMPPKYSAATRAIAPARPPTRPRTNTNMRGVPFLPSPPDAGCWGAG